MAYTVIRADGIDPIVNFGDMICKRMIDNGFISPEVSIWVKSSGKLVCNVEARLFEDTYTDSVNEFIYGDVDDLVKFEAKINAFVNGLKTPADEQRGQILKKIAKLSDEIKNSVLDQDEIDILVNPLLEASNKLSSNILTKV